MSEKKGHDSMDSFPHAEEVIKAFSSGKRFAEDLLKENERLRYKVLNLKQELSRVKIEGYEGGADVQDENRKLKMELESIKADFDNLNRESQDFQQRYEEVEKQNENLLNLYVSGYQLHSTLQEEGVRAIIQEILLNLLGAEVFTLWVVDQEGGKLEPLIFLDEKGFFGDTAPELSQKLKEEMAAGESFFAEGVVAPQEPLVCIPLQLEGKTMGVLAIYKLLEQKEGINSLDQELMGLLTSQAATAIIGSMSFSRTGSDLLSLSR